MVKRWIAWLLVVAALLLSVGCGSNETPPVGEQEPSPPSEPQGLVIDEEYVIVFPQAYDLYIDRASSILQSAIREMTGVKVGITSERTEAVAKEIVVGYCNRFDAASITSPITIQGEKLIFAAKDPAALYCIAEAFVDNCISAGALDSEGRLLLDEETISRIASTSTVYEQKITVLTQNLRYRDDEGGNSVAERSERFLALVEDYDPDIIGTQEATPLWTQYLDEFFSEEYTRIGVFRDGTGAAGDEANYILYRTDRFTEIDSGTFWLYDKTPDIIGKVDDALCNRICTWALLKDNRSGEQIFVCNTHLDHSTDSVRAEQLAVLLEYLDYELSHYPVIMTGDFNMLQDSVPYKSLTKAGLRDGQKSAWLDESKVNYSCHLYQNSGSRIDYCFHSVDLMPFYAKIIDDDYGGYVSDHYGVLVELVPMRKQ
ncbi:MAG: endonuclease/exonuclease/phosphatase family protein [Clostridia bacterium]|nr:endonuclease/exonuclease/phosphatase family protein [Clostridia bacterium]